MKLIKTLHGRHGSIVNVYKDAGDESYQVRVVGSPDATYDTDGLRDALSTAAWMLGDAEVNSPRRCITQQRVQRSNAGERA